MAKNDTPEIDAADAGDAPLIDLNDASIKKLIARAKKRGIVTYEELNEALPQDQMSSEQIEDIMSALNDMGINVVESAEDSDDEEDDKDDGKLHKGGENKQGTSDIGLPGGSHRRRRRHRRTDCGLHCLSVRAVVKFKPGHLTQA
jgi:hypothetical protein